MLVFQIFAYPSQLLRDYQGLSNSFSVKSRVGEVMLVGKGYDYLRWIGLR